ncbi:MAG TPA: hypothetical protein VK826_12640 [Bacteroidia bacterium]|nr:hypothetical protein [Bacteroidia bacterium]
MKKIVVLFFVVLTTIASAQDNPGKTSFVDGAEYNNYIIDQQTLIGMYFDEFGKTLVDTTLTKDQIHTKRMELAGKVKVCSNNIHNMPPWKGNSSLRDTAIILFDFYCNVFEFRYKKLVNCYFVEPFTEDESAEIDGIDISIQEDEDRLLDNLILAQENFAKKFGFVLNPE